MTGLRLAFEDSERPAGEPLSFVGPTVRAEVHGDVEKPQGFIARDTPVNGLGRIGLSRYKRIHGSILAVMSVAVCAVLHSRRVTGFAGFRG